MPWVDTEKCTGCGICVKKCPVDTISLEKEVPQSNAAEYAAKTNKSAVIYMEGCIRCGICHQVCPQHAVRHDSEKIPQLVQANIDMTKGFMQACADHFGSPHEKQKCLKRMLKHFNKEKIVMEKTLEELNKLENTQGIVS